MGYDVHITRKTDWFDEDGPAITLAEWTDYLSNDPDMRLDGFTQASTDAGDTLRIEADGLAVSTGYNRDGQDGNHVWFAFGDSGIVVKNPDADILRKMHAVATALGAKVQGDEGEVCDPDGSPQDVGTAGPAGKRPWWRFW